ncbi:MAG: SCP2 sterol-binding domain-containing protein [Thiothrix sp.]|nr:SCP2 sterol-binding domain-containing protein [Thiothrix sp.]HPQ94265.1 SCP2 sterol-binding domain-containing protein [Thiolinea sp.]
MPELFSAAWMNELKDQWNNDPDVRGKLAEIGFNSIIACGFKDEEQPRGIFVVENGTCVRAGDYRGEKPDWDMRAHHKDWMKWVANGIGMAGLGMAYTTGKLKFKSGDYSAMIKNPKMAGPFVKSFGLMKNISTQ